MSWRLLPTVTYAVALASFAAPVSASAQQPGLRTRMDTARIGLQEAVALALVQHPSIGRARAELERADALAGEARSAIWPRLMTEWSAQRFEEPMVVSPIHGFTAGVLPEFDRTLIQGNVGASWLLFDGGARSARITRAESSADAADAAVAAACASMVAGVTRAYLGVLTARETLVAHDARSIALAAERQRAQRLFDEGRAARVAVLRAEAASSRARADHVAAQADLDEREADLARLIGRDAGSVAAASLDSVSPTSARPEDAVTLRRLAAANDPAVQRARRLADASRAGIREARGAYLPSLSLAGRYNEFGSGAGDFTGEWQGGIQLSYALFTGGARGEAVERARAEARAAEAAVALAELEAAATVDRALTELTRAAASTEALTAAVAQFEEVVAVERLASEAGAGTQTDYLRAESDLLDARASLSAARYAEIAARVELARATGRLSLAWLTTNLEIRR